MDRETLERELAAFLRESPENYISEEDALRPELTGMRIYDAPLLGVAAAEDPLFRTLQQPGVVGPEAFLPGDWLPDAKSVLSFFLPFTEEVRRSNREKDGKASHEWLHARIEGQILLNRLGAYLCERLEALGFAAVYPAADSRFGMIAPLVSNWSERHVAYVCGLGTFGVSRGLITQKGMAGRFGSVVTTAVLSASERGYSDPFAYCILCGKCQEKCPVGAIDIRRGMVDGKDQSLCAPFVNGSRLPPHGPHQRSYYGCGKCQVGVPCESGIPVRRK